MGYDLAFIFLKKLLNRLFLFGDDRSASLVAD